MQFCKTVPVVMFFVAAPALAHPGPRVWLGLENDKIVTYTSINDNDTAPTGFVESHLFLAGGQEGAATADGQLSRASANPASTAYDTWTTTWPGYQVRTDTNNFVAGMQLGYTVTKPLQYFNGSEFVSVQDEFGGTATPVPQLQISVGQPNPDTSPGQPSTITVSRTTANGGVGGDTFFYYADNSTHTHPRYTLLGDGTSAGGGPDGIYAITLQLGGAGLISSDPYVLLMAKNVAVGSSAYLDAIAAAPALTPEPGTLSLLLMGGALLMRRRNA